MSSIIEPNDTDNRQKESIIPKLGVGLVCQKPTEVIVTEFANLTFIIATQLQKVGVYVEVIFDATVPEQICAAYDSRVLFGKDEPEVHAVSRSLVERFQFPKKVLFGFGLLDYTATSTKELGDLIAEVIK